jgi:His-Xaa-Ser system protein HxsD
MIKRTKGAIGMNVHVQKDGQGDRVSQVILIDGSLHPSAAILRSCYALADIATFDVSNEAGQVSVRVFPASGHLPEAVIDRFRTSLIDFTLREEIEARTKGMRDLIWQTAFAEVKGRNQ